MQKEPVARVGGTFDPSLDRCPECGHLWGQGDEGHEFDCRYFAVEECEEEETGSLPEGESFSRMSPAQGAGRCV